MNETKQELQERLRKAKLAKAKAEAEIAAVREQLAKVEESTTGGFFVEPKIDDRYWFVSADGKLSPDIWFGASVDVYRHSVGNCFTSDEAGIKAAEWYKVKLSWLGLNSGKPMPKTAWCVDTLRGVYETRFDCHPYTWLAWATGRLHATREGAERQLEQIQEQMKELGL